MSEATQEVISGLEGVLAFESSIAFIDGSIPELSFRGYDIKDIAQALTFEEAAYLLWNDRLPGADELTGFSAELAAPALGAGCAHRHPARHAGVSASHGGAAHRGVVAGRHGRAGRR